MTQAEKLSDAEKYCAAEPIHRLGLVQSHGVVLACDPRDFRIHYASANSHTLLGLSVDALVGAPLAHMGEALLAMAKDATAHPPSPDGSPHCVKRRMPLGLDDQTCEVTTHRWQEWVFVEIQKSSNDVVDLETVEVVDSLSQRLSLTGDVNELCSVACAEIQKLTGYQRVLAYEFDSEWNGLVIAESPREGEPVRYRGLHFPASDIPPQARALYHAVPLRVIADADDAGTPLVGADGTTVTPDLSHSLLRAVSPMHLAYLRNMGVQATIAISLMVNGRLWGLIVAHDDHPRTPPQHVVHALRVICRVMGQLVATRLLALEHRRLQLDDRALLDLVERISLASATALDPRLVWGTLHDEVVDWFQADGALLIHGGEPQTSGDPGDAVALGVLDTLRRHSPEALFATTSLYQEGLVEAGCPVSGVIWAPLPTSGHALLLWRNESTREVFWGGDPNKAMVGGTDGQAPSPRRSFAQWKEVRRDHSVAWTPNHLEGARRIIAQWQLLVLDEERRRAEATIRKLEAGILQVNDGVVIARADPEAGLIVEFANPLFEAQLHHGASARGRTPAFLDASVVEPAACAAIRRALASGESSQFEIFALDGRWFEIALAPVVAPGEPAGHWAAILRDVTQRRREEVLKSELARAHQETNERYARILETSHEGILTLNDRGEVDYCNHRMLDILGVATAPLGTPFEAILTDPTDAAQLLDSRLASHLVRRREVEFRSDAGRPVACDLALIPLRQQGVQRSGSLVMVTDISDRKSLENSLLLLNANLEATVAERTAQLVSAKESADEANRSKSEFLANMSHELRSPLHGILGFTQLLIEDQEIPLGTRDKYLKKVERNAGNLLALVNDLLDSAKIESKSFSMQPSRCDLVEIVRNVVAEFQSDGSPNSTIKVLLPPAAPCDGDSFRLAQVLRNLVANAIRFSPAGSRVHVAIERAEGGWIMAVRDRGPGVPPNELESIFDRFAQSSTTKTGAGGTGLGLHIARGIIKSHGGTLIARNREDGGAAFEAFIPDPK